MGGQNLTLAVSRENPPDWLRRVHVSRSAAQKPQRHSSPRTHNSWTCTRQPTATERADARAALRIRRAAPYRCCRRLQGRSGERRRPLNDRRGDAVQGAAVARDKLSSAFLCTVTARQSRQRAQRVTRAEQPRACAHCGRAVVAANRMAAAAARSQREQIEMDIRHGAPFASFVRWSWCERSSSHHFTT